MTSHHGDKPVMDIGAPKQKPRPEPRIRDEIRRASTEALIRHGYRGFRFQRVADQLGITRGNVHYHFGNKEALTEEIIVEYAGATLKMFEEVWLAQDTSLQTKIHQTKDLNYRRYLSFNPGGDTGHPWGLIARMRAESEILSARARHALARFGAGLERCINRGIEIAIENGELRPDAPVSDIALLLVSIANSAGPITQDAGSFERLEQLYVAVARLVQHAYGSGAVERRRC